VARLGRLAPLGELTGDLRERLDAVLRDIGFGRLVGVEVLDWEPGRARTRLVPGPEQTNVHGFVHGTTRHRHSRAKRSWRRRWR
jgi:hypothetical protein